MDMSGKFTFLQMDDIIAILGKSTAYCASIGYFVARNTVVIEDCWEASDIEREYVEVATSWGSGC